MEKKNRDLLGLRTCLFSSSEMSDSNFRRGGVSLKVGKMDLAVVSLKKAKANLSISNWDERHTNPNIYHAAAQSENRFWRNLKKCE
jgi:hypothetical protein